MAYPHGVPNPSGSPNEKIEFANFANLSKYDLERLLASMDLDSDETRKLSQAIARYSEAQTENLRSRLRDLERWVNTHTHPGVVPAPGEVAPDSIFIFGGTGFSTDESVSARLYRTVAGTWTTLANMNTPSYEGHQGARIGENIYIVGGDTTGGGVPTAKVRVYNIPTDTWDYIPDLPFTRWYGSVVADSLGRLHVLGGNGGDGTRVDKHYVIDPVNDSAWSNLAILPIGKAGNRTVGLFGFLYNYLGSHGGGTASDRMDIYDPDTDSWSPGTASPTSPGLSAIGATDGAYAYYVFNTTAYKYDAGADTWAAIATIDRKNNAGGAAGFSGKLWVPGGSVGTSVQDDHHEYEEDTNSWVARAVTPVRLHNHCVVAGPAPESF